MSKRIIAEIVASEMILERHPISGQRVVFNFVTPSHWRTGDIVTMDIHLNPYDLNFADGRVVVTVAPEPTNEWKHEFYCLHNDLTKDRVTVDFHAVEGFEKLETEHPTNVPNPHGGRSI